MFFASRKEGQQCMWRGIRLLQLQLLALFNPREETFVNYSWFLSQISVRRWGGRCLGNCNGRILLEVLNVLMQRFSDSPGCESLSVGIRRTGAKTCFITYRLRRQHRYQRKGSIRDSHAVLHVLAETSERHWDVMGLRRPRRWSIRDSQLGCILFAGTLGQQPSLLNWQNHKQGRRSSNAE